MGKKSCLVRVKIEAFDENMKKIGERNIDDDLLTDNFGSFWKAFFQEWSIARTQSLTRTDGASVTITINSESTAIWNPGVGAGRGSRIAIGTGTSSPQRSDYNLEATLSSQVNADAVWISAAGEIRFATTFIYSSPVSISEVGWLFRMYALSSGTWDDFLFSRQTFSSLEGIVFTVTYTIKFM